jgi:demethylmenaquinone methyltransferase/2-methoxy-6-polyprenyl-1,4-benzoquinol methylase
MQAPHPPLLEYYEREADRRGWLRQLFDCTAVDYDRVERLMALGSGSRYRRLALQRAGLAPGMRVLDVGVGTGLTARQASTIVGEMGRVTGVDPSPGMLERAHLPANVSLLVGSAESIPAPDACADFLSMGFALRHIADFSLAFNEFLRVLAPGGRICLLEITRPRGRIAHRLLRTYMRDIVPFVARHVGAKAETPQLMRYYWDTIEACAAPAQILEALQAAGFTDVCRHVELGIFSEYRGRRPL